ncbi:RHS repeat-associated core domain-containing protein [Caulobacter sp. NIBR1757]|uniref:RHS repeat-associated core domain-containing protein n=1 Tax=Caulobacter sp. NIBR1757 TaxID=3016000 RepID=UPI0022F115E6|nr:RHS repeat-associated core domain-containing protein [Caulobacter sp. NIBR1757]
MTIVRGVPITPTAADSYFAGLPTALTTTHTDGLCQRYPGNPDICPAAGRPRAPEVRELARALRHDPNLIYEYVYNTIETELMFGSHKGSLGTIIDQSGTPFDQAQLMVDLLRESGIDARFKYGWVNFFHPESQGKWAPGADEAAACMVLATGGIPYDNECASKAQNFKVAQIWVEAYIDGAWRFFDPSLKSHEGTRGINTTATDGLRATVGLTKTAIENAATPALATEGAGDIRTTGAFDPGGLNGLLQGSAEDLLDRIENDPALQGANLTDIIGGRRILPETRPAGGYLRAAPDNGLGTRYYATQTWTEIPDAYRATVKLSSEVATTPTPTVYINATFFADEIYGRRLELVSKQGGEEPVTPTTETWTPQLILDGVRLDIGAPLPGTLHQNIVLQITADHPFPASGGTYGDAIVTKQIKILDAATLVVAWGSTSSRMVDKWATESAFELLSATMISNPLGEQPDAQPSGNGLRAQIAATWLAQFSWATHLHAELADAEPIILHTLGVVSQDQNLARIPDPPVQPGMEIGGDPSGVSTYDEITVVDLETSFGLVSRQTEVDPKVRRGALHAIAATGAALEGSVIAQLVDSPDAASTAARFAWGLSPEANESPSQSARPFYYLTGGTTAARGLAADSFAGSTMFDGGTTEVAAYNPSNDGFDALPKILLPMVDNMRGKLSGTVKQYAAADYDVTVSAEASLGPGHRYGSEYGEYTYTIEHHIGGTTTGYAGWSCIPGPRFPGASPPPDTVNPNLPENDFDWLQNYDCDMGGTWGHLEFYSEVGEINTGDTVTRTRTHFSRLPGLQRGGALLATRYDPNNADEPVAIANVLTRYGHPTKGGGGPAVTAASDFKPNEAAQSLKDRFVDRSSAMGVDMRKGQAGFRSPVLASVGTGEFPYRLDRVVELRGGTLGFVPSVDPTPGTAPTRREGPVTNWDHSAAISNSGFEGMGQSRVEAAVPTIVAFMAMQETWGQMAKGGRRDVIGSLAADWWAKRLLFNVVTVFSGGDAQQFVRLIDDSFRPTEGGAAKLVMTGDREVKRPRTPRTREIGADQKESVNRAWKYNGVSFELTNANGDRKTFEYWGAQQFTDAAYLDADHGWRMTKWSFPQGVELKVDYYALEQVLGGYTGGFSSIPSHVGLYKSGLTATAIGPGLELPKIVSTASLDTASGYPCASLSLTNSENETTRVTFRRQMTRTVNQRPDLECRPLEVFGPSDQVVPSLRYTYDSTNRVMEARDATAIRQPGRGPHQFFIADGYRGERQDPAGGRYASETLRGGRETRHYDELFFAPYGTETARPPVITRLDGRGRVLERTFPEGDKVAFTYDAVDNPTKLTKYPKPGSSLAPQEIKASWNTTWNKPEWIEDARGNRTDFTYYDTGNGKSLLKEAKRPLATSASTLRATYKFEYNDIGLLSRSQDPDLIWTAFSYDALACPTLVQVEYVAQNLKKYSRCDAYGNVAEVWDERGETATKTTTTFDSLRRPLEVVGPLGVRARTTYDKDGRPTRVEKFYDDPAVAGVPALTDASAWRVWKTGYTPTGQIAWTEDPDHDVALFEYDKLDRKTAAVAPTGERSEWVYDLGGQLRIVRSAVGVTCTGGIACVQDTETYAYTLNGQKASLTDARALGSTTFQYDGFDRLMKTIFPTDSTYEESTYDASGNVLTFRTREGRYIVAGYDNLDRKIWEKGLRDPVKTCLAPTPVCETDDPPEEARMRDAAFTYELSGRMETASTDQVIKSWEYDDAGRPKKHITQVLGGAGVYFTPVPTTMTRAFEYEWDVVGNLTKLVYPEVGFEQTSGTGDAAHKGGLYATYSYDVLNRMTGVTTTGVNMTGLPAASVTIAYDNLSRRTQLSFGDGSIQKYYYEQDDDLLQLEHTFPLGSGSNNVTFSYANDKSGRQISETIAVNNGSTDYLYNPATVASVYDPANGLNQYPKVDTKTFTYRTDGPMTYDGVRYFAYDERRNLTLARQGALTAGNYEQDLYDALGARWYSARAATTIADTRRVELTDGLRPEVAVEEMINIPEGTTDQDAAGGRFSVMGPNPDERLIWIDATATALQVRYVHASRRGDARILSKGGAPERKYTYSAFGESTDNVTGYPWRFTGQRFNSWTGLYHFKARAYSPALGRFMQPDPIGYEDGPNIYAYCTSDPINCLDPLGTFADEKFNPKFVKPGEKFGDGKPRAGGPVTMAIGTTPEPLA